MYRLDSSIPDDREEAIVGTWGYFSYPTEPPGLSDEEWWEWEGRMAELEARPTYEELMEQYDNEVEEL